ncbi:MAG: DedA family protein [Chloroflexota bacterium]
MNELAAWLLAYLPVYTYPVVGATVLIGAIGVPLPSTVVVLAAAGFSADGDPSPTVLAGVVYGAAVVGDLLSYAGARRGGSALLESIGPRLGVNPWRVAAVEGRLERWGGLFILATRFLLTGLALPANLAAGVGGYPAWRFALFAALGEGVWAAELVALGWWYGANWIALVEYINNALTALTTLTVAGIGVWLLVRLLRARPGRA